MLQAITLVTPYGEKFRAFVRSDANGMPMNLVGPIIRRWESGETHGIEAGGVEWWVR